LALHAGDTLARDLRVFAGTFRLSSAAATNVLRKSVSSACLRRAISRKRGEIAHATFPDDLFYGLRVVGKRLSTIANER
jgi:hypothetical protein